MSFWVFLNLELEKPIEIFGISTLKFAEMQKIVQNNNNKKFRTENTLFEYCGM